MKPARVGIVRYYKNGSLLFTSSITPTYPLVLDASLLHLGAAISDAVIAGRLNSDTVPPGTANITSSGAGASSVTITWTTTEASDSQVEYGSTTAYGSATTLDPSMVTFHSRSLGGLAADTLYHYRVRSRDAAGNLVISGDFTFTTGASTPRLEDVIWIDIVNAVATGSSLQKT